MEKLKWRWSPLHWEQMVPGSFWSVKNETSLFYLEDAKSVYVYLHGNNYYGYFRPSEPLSFELDKVYFLSKIEEQDGNYVVTFLDDTKILETKVSKGCWDSVFVLVQPSTDSTEPEQQGMFLGRIPIERVLKKMSKRKSK